MAGVAFATIVADCELMQKSIEPLLPEMPHLAPEHEEIRAFLADVQTLNVQQKELTGQLRQTTRLRREAEKRGTDLRARVAALLRGKLGFKNEQLLKFGVPPRRKARRKPEETGGPTPPTTPTPEAETP